MKKIFLAVFCAFLGLNNAFGADIDIKNIRAKASKAGSNNSAIFMDIKNTSNADIKLLSVNSSVCKNTEMHTHKHENNLSVMAQVDSILIPKNSEVKLASGGFHIMLINLNKPINEGDTIDLEMKFDNGEVINLSDIQVNSK